MQPSSKSDGKSNSGAVKLVPAKYVNLDLMECLRENAASSLIFSSLETSGFDPNSDSYACNIGTDLYRSSSIISNASEFIALLCFDSLRFLEEFDP